MTNKFGDLPAVSNAYAPDVLADELLSMELINGTVRMTFGVIKMAEACAPSPVQMVALGRLVMGVDGAQRLAIGLFDYLKQQGHDPRALVGSGEAKAKPN